MAYFYRADVSSYTETSYPAAEAAKSVDELQTYYENYKEIYQFHIGYYGEASMADEFFSDNTRYDDAFFENNFLLFVIIEEGSGSVRHRVESALPENGLLSVNVTRVVPEIGTADMAQWHIVLELDKTLSDMDVAVVVSDDHNL